jgi:hypothetical protein
MQYTVDVAADAAYDIHVRVASGSTGGNFHFTADGADITIPYYVPNTGGWNTWQTVIIPDVILSTTDEKIRLYADNDGFNLGSFEFIQTGATTSILTEFISAETVDANTVMMNINKKLDANSFPTLPANFTIYADGNSIPITNIVVDSDNPRIVYFTVNHTMKASEVLEISYNGTQIMATDGSTLAPFSFENIENNLSALHQVPGKIESEDFVFQSGVQLETTTDIGGGENIGFLDVNDYLDYEVEVTTAGTYKVEYRVASEATGGIALQLLDTSGTPTILHLTSFPATGGWQTWQTYDENTFIPAGEYTLRVLITQSPFNMNWMNFSLLTNTNETKTIEKINIFPNPSTGFININATLQTAQDATIEIYNLLGQSVYNDNLKNRLQLQETVNTTNFQDGYYVLFIRLADGSFYSEKFLKMAN